MHDLRSFICLARLLYIHGDETSTGRYIRNLVRYLERLDQQHYYNIMLKPGDMEKWEPISPTFHKVSSSYKEFGIGEQLGFKHQLNKLKADLVHFGMTQQPVLYRGKTITTIHDLTTARFTNPAKNPLTFGFKQHVYKRVIKRAARHSSFLIVPSQFVKQDLVQFTGINPDKVIVIYEAADPINEGAVPFDELNGRQFIMYVGRSTPHKNLEKLIEAFGFIRAQHPDLLLVLAGKKDSNYQRIEKKVLKNSMKNIIFTDFISDGQLRWLYENCDAYVFPSLSEGFGLPGLEAMLHGAPVISSSASCLPEIFGDAAHYFDPHDIQSIVNAINRVLINRNLRAELIQKGKDQVAKYSWQRTAEQTLQIYSKVLND
jgi:glycosyltransferase involved in cell wall biosynthesis